MHVSLKGTFSQGFYLHRNRSARRTFLPVSGRVSTALLDGRQETASVDYGQHQHPVSRLSISVNDPVRGNDDFAVAGLRKLRDQATTLGELS